MAFVPILDLFSNVTLCAGRRAGMGRLVEAAPNAQTVLGASERRGQL